MIVYGTQMQANFAMQRSRDSWLRRLVRPVIASISLPPEAYRARDGLTVSERVEEGAESMRRSE